MIERERAALRTVSRSLAEVDTGRARRSGRFGAM